MATRNEYQPLVIEMQAPHSTAPLTSQRPNSLRVGSANAVAQELKPVDRGRDAWIVLLAGFVFEALFWGISPPNC